MLKSERAVTVFIMAGGTGGHVFPALAVAEQLKRLGARIEWLGASKGIETELVPQHGYTLHQLPTVGLRGKSKLSQFFGGFKLILAIIKSLQLFAKNQPDVVLGMGGYAAGPGGVAAFIMGKPLILHEQNSVPGTTNRLLAIFAKRIYQGFPSTLGGKKGQFVGNPVRESLETLPSPAERQLGQHQPMRLLILGGSLGAKPINTLLPEAIGLLDDEQRPDIIHQAGRLHSETVTADYKHKAIKADVRPFIKDMSAVYAWADLVVCRAGALTVAEISAVGLPAIFIPLPHAIDDHQTMNAAWLADNNAAWLLPQKNLTPHSLSNLIAELLADKQCLLTTAENAKQQSTQRVAATVAAGCMELANA